MRTAAYNVDVASDCRRRKNVPRHILCSVMAARRALKRRKNEVEMPRTDGIMKQESAEEYLMYMGSAMENKGIMYVLASKPYHEVKEPGFKGDTATGATKPATVETGATVSVPLFVNQHDVIKIDTRTGEYLSRV